MHTKLNTIDGAKLFFSCKVKYENKSETKISPHSNWTVDGGRTDGWKKLNSRRELAVAIFLLFYTGKSQSSIRTTTNVRVFSVVANSSSKYIHC